MHVDDDARVVELARGMYEGRVLEARGNLGDHIAELCCSGCTLRHAFFYVRHTVRQWVGKKVGTLYAWINEECIRYLFDRLPQYGLMLYYYCDRVRAARFVNN